MISAGDDGLIRIWCLKTGLMVASLRGHTVNFCSCVFSYAVRRVFVT